MTNPRIALALQGGGATGAFGWGVLDRLLAEPDIANNIVAISGVSAGAVNGVLAADGLLKGSPAKARANLHSFWQLLIESAPVADPLLKTFLWQRKFLKASASMGNPLARLWLKNYLLHNPIPGILNSMGIDWRKLQQQEKIQLFISAAHADSWAEGHGRVFSGNDINEQTLAATTSLEEIFGHIWVDGKPLIDGHTPPPLMPLAVEAKADVILLIRLKHRTNQHPFTVPLYEEELRLKEWLNQHKKALRNELAQLHYCIDEAGKATNAQKKRLKELNEAIAHEPHVRLIDLGPGMVDLQMKDSDTMRLDPAFLRNLYKRGQEGGELLIKRLKEPSSDDYIS